MRVFLKKILKFYAKWAIRKHSIELVVVTGWTGVELVKEGVYTVLNQKYIVRRNTKQVWWDLSLPLNILGYDDKQRSVFGWAFLIIKIFFVLISSNKNQHILVLSAHSQHESTAKYWKEFIKPDFLVVIQNLKKSTVTTDLINVTQKRGGVIIHEKDDISANNIKNKFIFGKEGKTSKVIYKTNKDNITVSYKKNNIIIPKEFLPPFARNIVAAIVSFSIARGIEFDDINGGLIKFDLRGKFIKEVIQKINTNE